MKYRKLAKTLKKCGCVEMKSKGKGSHRKWYNPQSEKAATLPFYKNREFTAWTVRDIVEQLGIDWDDFKKES